MISEVKAVVQVAAIGRGINPLAEFTGKWDPGCTRNSAAP